MEKEDEYDDKLAAVATLIDEEEEDVETLFASLEKQITHSQVTRAKWTDNHINRFKAENELFKDFGKAHVESLDGTKVAMQNELKAHLEKVELVVKRQKELLELTKSKIKDYVESDEEAPVKTEEPAQQEESSDDDIDGLLAFKKKWSK